MKRTHSTLPDFDEGFGDFDTNFGSENVDRIPQSKETETITNSGDPVQMQEPIVNPEPEIQKTQDAEFNVEFSPPKDQPKLQEEHVVEFTDSFETSFESKEKLDSIDEKTKSESPSEHTPQELKVDPNVGFDVDFEFNGSTPIQKPLEQPNQNIQSKEVEPQNHLGQTKIDVGFDVDFEFNGSTPIQKPLEVPVEQINQNVQPKQEDIQGHVDQTQEEFGFDTAFRSDEKKNESIVEPSKQNVEKVEEPKKESPKLFGGVEEFPQVSENLKPVEIKSQSISNFDTFNDDFQPDFSPSEEPKPEVHEIKTFSNFDVHFDESTPQEKITSPTVVSEVQVTKPNPIPPIQSDSFPESNGFDVSFDDDDFKVPPRPLDEPKKEIPKMETTNENFDVSFDEPKVPEKSSPPKKIESTTSTQSSDDFGANWDENPFKEPEQPKPKESIQTSPTQKQEIKVPVTPKKLEPLVENKTLQIDKDIIIHTEEQLPSKSEPIPEKKVLFSIPKEEDPHPENTSPQHVTSIMETPRPNEGC